MSGFPPVYRPLSPATPAHTPHGSVGSIRSRTPGQLSLHEYRRQQANSSPLSEGSTHRVRKKVAALHLNNVNPAQGILTAPPTPLDASFDADHTTNIDSDREFADLEVDEDEDAIIDANILKYSVGRAKKEYLQFHARESTIGRASFPRGHRGLPSTASSTSTSTLTRTLPAHRESRISQVVVSSRVQPSDVSSRQLRHKHNFTPSQVASRVSTETSSLTTSRSAETVVLPQSPPATNRSVLSQPKHLRVDDPTMSSPAKLFKTIKRLPRPTQPAIEPEQHIMDQRTSDNSESQLMATTHDSPFTLSNFQFPPVPLHRLSALRKSQSYDDSGKPVKVSSSSVAELSFSDLLYLYGADKGRTSKDESSSSSKLSRSQSEQSVEAPHALFLSPPASKHALPRMSSFVNDAFNSRPLHAGHAYPVGGDLMPHLNRESMYTENWDSRSIIDVDNDVPPGRALGIVDYTDVERDLQHDSYTPINSIFDQYGRLSGDSASHRALQTAGRPPASPPPPVPPLPLPKSNLPAEPSSIEHTTDYGLTADLLHLDTSIQLEHARSNAVPLEQTPTPLLDPSSVYDTSASPMPAFAGDPETVSIALSTLSDEWQTIANTSTNELSGNFSSMADYAFSPFPTHYMPPLQTNQQRRAVTYDEIPEIPSPQSTLPELDVFRYDHDMGSPSQEVAHSEYSADLRSIPNTPDHTHYSPMRYSLHDGADLVDAFPDRPEEAAMTGLTMPLAEHQADKTTVDNGTAGLVDINMLSSEPNDVIDVDAVSLTDTIVKRRATLTSMLLGRVSKRSSRNFANQRNLIELQMPKRTSSLRATELQHHRIRPAQTAGPVEREVIAADTHDIVDENAKLERLRAETSESLADKRLDRHALYLERSYSQYGQRAQRQRPASSAASTDPLVHSANHHAITVSLQDAASLDEHETGGLRQIYLAEEGACTHDSGAKHFSPAIVRSDREYRQQLRRSRLWLIVFLPFPFFLVLYAFGLVDKLAGPGGMLKHYKRWARYLVVVEIVLVLIALTVWGVARRGV